MTERVDELMPTLKRIEVDVDKLLLDPNNPRFRTHDDDYVDEDRFLDSGVIENTRRKMDGDDTYRLNELERSILENGWVPVDQIFVRQYSETDRFVVLEGNRRVTALRRLRQRQDLEPEQREKIERINPLSVMLVIDDCGPEVLKRRITYLLGVRHHGSLKPWSPFAQAKNMYEKYLQLSGMSDETFDWQQGGYAEHVADALSVKPKDVLEKLSVYRVMQQLDVRPEVQEAGGMKSHYYSICNEVLSAGSKSALREYIVQHPVSLTLEEESAVKLVDLCHFNVPNREGAPINVPPEWRKLDRILQDEDGGRREEMLHAVEEKRLHPSDVWAQREAELTVPRWDTWLREASLLLKSVQFGDDLESPEAREAGARLGELLEKLSKAEGAGGPDA